MPERKKFRVVKENLDAVDVGSLVCKKLGMVDPELTEIGDVQCIVGLPVSAHGCEPTSRSAAAGPAVYSEPDPETLFGQDFEEQSSGAPGET